MATDAALDSIGDRLRGARERSGLTLDQLAEVCGISKPHLSRLETGERQPSVSALLALARALDTRVSTLLGESDDGTPIGISPDDGVRQHARGLSIAPCSGYAGSTALEAIRVEVEADRLPAAPSSHAGEEWLYVLTGVLSLEYDGEVHYLGPGTAAHFDAIRPHRLGAEVGRVELLLVAAHESRTLLRAHR